ncbi:MAG: hypothetical protein DWQ18_02680 [Crenarchaeota archaeon]|nr:MAG: hypothetical protein DWQ17_05850 [Thermoproteota archaeon]RDJ33839.1 MAG: hypothetical protein DWQ18_02680 [Thermoproteota archaeon]RDJ37051.1 MAG: hypothetical protein DWQ13_07940 [Thermoproteota archaeon]RDJ37414.1 MAG: hypothetical protein DWQ19_02895 [Thermoproteota archaeon]
MSGELTKKAVEMLLKGATLLGEPCPYCKGVRVMKDGHALCVNCGKEPKEEKNTETPKTTPSMTEMLENKLNALSSQLEKENDPTKQQEILKTINSILETIEKIKKS